MVSSISREKVVLNLDLPDFDHSASWRHEDKIEDGDDHLVQFLNKMAETFEMRESQDMTEIWRDSKY